MIAACGKNRFSVSRIPLNQGQLSFWKIRIQDKAGFLVRNIRSAISLFDRALFINTLFKEDYALYDKTIGELNELSTLDEAVDYVAARFPDWNFGSDVVYSFMMAIRKKLG